MNREEKKTKLSVSSLLIKSLRTNTLAFHHQLQVFCFQFLSKQKNHTRRAMKMQIWQQYFNGFDQRWSPRGRPWPRGRPRGQILKSLALALASKVKSLALALASRPQVLENWPVLGSRTALFFGKLKFCGAVEKFFGKRFFRGDRLKTFL